MKKKILLIALISGAMLTGCNKQILDTNYTFTKAIIDGVGKVEIKSWNDYEQSDMVQVTDKNGVVYLTHSSNVVLMSK